MNAPKTFHESPCIRTSAVYSSTFLSTSLTPLLLGLCCQCTAPQRPDLPAAPRAEFVEPFPRFRCAEQQIDPRRQRILRLALRRGSEVRVLAAQPVAEHAQEPHAITRGRELDPLRVPLPEHKRRDRALDGLLA